MHDDTNRPHAIAILGAGASQIPLIHTIKEMGYSAIAIDRDPHAPGFLHAHMCIHKSTHDTPGVIEALGGAGCALAGVLARTTAAEALHTAAAIAEEFHLPGLTDELVCIASGKASLREFCRRHAVPVPIGMQTSSNTPEVKDLTFPLIVRPDRSIVGKSCIRLCPDRDALFASVGKARDASFNHAADIGQYIEGIDTTCLCWAHQGKSHILAWWDELVGIGADHTIIGLGLSIPSVIEGKPAQERAASLVGRIVEKFPQAGALLLLSFRITLQGEPFLIEIHADLGGDLIAEAFLPAAHDSFDFFALAVRVATASYAYTAPCACRPTALAYCPDGSILQGDGITRIHDAIIAQRSSIGDNLDLLSNLIDVRGLQLIKRPLHMEWLKEKRP